MIFKRIAARSRRTSEPNRISRLIRYIATPEKNTSPDADGFAVRFEKCTYFRAINYFCDPTDISAICEETIALAEQKHPNASSVINHYLLSWDRLYRPSNSDIDQCVKILMTKFETLDCQYIYGRHDDTDNIHVHIVINRVNPTTNQTHRINGGFDIKCGHLAREQIQSELNIAPVKKSMEPAYTPIEIETGFESRDRTISRLIIPLLDTSRSWEYFHLQLNEQGMALFRSGQGFAISMGNYFVRASKIDARLSKKNLEKKYGSFIPSLHHTKILKIADESPIQLIITDQLRMAIFSKYMRDREKFHQLKSQILPAIERDYNSEIEAFKSIINAKLKNINKDDWLNGEQIVKGLQKQIDDYKLERQQYWQDVAKQIPADNVCTFKNWCKTNNIDITAFYQITAQGDMEEQRLKIRINKNLASLLDKMTDEIHLLENQIKPFNHF